MDLKLNIHKIEINKMNLGHLVTLKSSPFLIEKNSQYPATTKLFKVSKLYSPFMCVTEVALDFTKQNQEVTKFKCKYFVPKKGVFEEKWFYDMQIQSLHETFNKQKTKYEELIKQHNGKTEVINAKHEKNPTEADKTALGKNDLYNKSLNNKISEIDKSISTDSNIDISIGSSVIFKSALMDACYNSEVSKGQIISPFMTVTAIEMEKNEKINIYDNQSQRVIREVSLYKIKCMWYNPIESKFSEDWFIPEALIEIK